MKHLVTSLKFSKVSVAISRIIKCSSLFELSIAMLFYSEIFSLMADTKEIQLRDKLLEKVVLSFENNVIMIKDEKRLDEVSMQERIKFALPSTTNSLKAFHGQLNSHFPRRNNFWNSTYRVCNNLLMFF